MNDFIHMPATSPWHSLQFIPSSLAQQNAYVVSYLQDGQNTLRRQRTKLYIDSLQALA